MAGKQYLDYAGLVRLVDNIKEYFAPIQAFLYKGSVLNVQSLPLLSEVSIGWVYTVQQEGTTTADFVEGAGLHLNPNSEVIAINTGTEAEPLLKWSVLGNLFDLSDKLTFGSSMPASPSDGDTFLYLGNTTYVFNEVTPSGDEDPEEEGWYEEDGQGGYVPTQDNTVVQGKDYYEREEQYVKGVIYVYNSTLSKWIPQSSGDIFVPITGNYIDSLFD